MPKRRMTAARRLQIKKWQLAGSKARRPRPHGKMITLRHYTPNINAAVIVQEQQFKPRWRKKDAGYVFFAKPSKRRPYASIYGSAAVSVKVPFRKIKSDTAEINSIMVHVNDLKGRKIKRVK